VNFFKFLAFTFVLVLAYITGLFAQQKPFWNDIQTIKQYDKIYAPPKEPILFVGSSSIRYWHNLAEIYSDYTVLNRGFGGSKINDVTNYVDDIITPYKPKQVIIYVGENDLLNEQLNGDSIFYRFKNLYTAIKVRHPQTPVAYISIKPSPVLERFIEKTRTANQLISGYLKTQPNSVFIDVFTPMLDKDGKTRPELFRTDRLHMNSAGYKIWENLVRPHLLEN